MGPPGREDRDDVEGGSVGSLLLSWMGRGVGSRAGGLLGVLLCAVLLGFGALAGDSGPANAQEYSAYDDAEKPVISYLFSQEENVEEFRREFGLDDEQVRRALAATQEEKATLEEEHAESERIVEANEGLPAAGIEQKIEASDYEGEVRAAVAKTKSKIEGLLPQEREDDLAAWVDHSWEREQEEFYAERTAEARRSGSLRCRTIHASWYKSRTENGNNVEVALPHRRIKLKGGFRVRVNHNGHKARLPVKEVGPWNIRDNYWAERKNRSMWRDLPRCKPEAEAAFFDNYNKGEDQFGREVSNPAGIDLTLAAAEKMGIKRKLKRQGIIKVTVRFLWVKR